MEKTDETQASNQSTMPAPAAGAESAPPAQPPMTPEMQAANESLAATEQAGAILGEAIKTGDFNALKNIANQYGLTDHVKAMEEKMNQIKPEVEALAIREQELFKKAMLLEERGKSASIKVMATQILSGIAGAFAVFGLIKNKDWGAFKKIGAYIGGGVVASLAGGMAGTKIFGSKLLDEGKDLNLQMQQIQVAREQLNQSMVPVSKNFVDALASKMAEAKKQAPAAAPNVEPPAAGIAPVAPSSVSSNAIKLSDSSVAPPAVISSQSLVGGVQSRGSSAVGALAKEPPSSGIGMP